MKKLMILATVLVCCAGEPYHLTTGTNACPKGSPAPIQPQKWNPIKWPQDVIVDLSPPGSEFSAPGKFMITPRGALEPYSVLKFTTNVNELPDDGIRYRRVISTTNRMMTVIFGGKTNAMQGEQIGESVTNWVADYSNQKGGGGDLLWLHNPNAPLQLGPNGIITPYALTNTIGHY